MKNISLLFSMLFCLGLAGQDTVRYTADFQFERGIYPTLEDWKQQQPVKPADIIVELDPNSSKFFQYLLAKEEFRYPRQNEIVYQKPEDIFGYSPGGERLYYGTEYRFEIVGAICLLREVGQVDTYSSFIKPGEEYEAAREEGSGKLYVLEFETGDFFRYRARKVKRIFKQDEELYEKYKNASGDKDDRIRAFIKEYNFRHPIYFRK